MNIKKVIFDSSAIFLFNLINLFFNFYIRKLFLINIGIESLGINGVFVNLMSLLMISEMGVSTAITYKLFKPISNQDYSSVKRLIFKMDNSYKKISLFISLSSLVIIPILPFIFANSDTSNFLLIIYFILQVLITISGYLFASRKLIFLVNHKQHLISFVELIINTLFSVIRYFIIIIFKNYLAFVILQLLQILTVNIIIYFISKKEFKYIYDKSIRMSDEDIDIKKDTGNLTSLSIFAFINNSSDNLLIAPILGVASVGLLVNYRFIPLILNDLISTALKPIHAAIGLTNSNIDIVSKRLLFRYNQFLRFFIANYFFLMLSLFLDYFIGIWFGYQYLLVSYFSILIALDIFISHMQATSLDFIIINGHFKDERNIIVFSSLINISISLLLTLKFGLIGVLIATVISQLLILLGRYTIVAKNILYIKTSEFIREFGILLGLTFGELLLLKLLVNFITITDMMQLILSAFYFSIIIIAFNLLIFSSTTEFKSIYKILKTKIKNGIKNKSS